ncbi:MAG: hypothetical protein JWR38_619 [Mucilaginibacter sp.]|nr:hypothetical protein [Mucilaginibacter sp.]
MKALIKYISLLLFSGLIIPFCTQHHINSPDQLKLRQPSDISFKMQVPGFILIKDIIKNSFPVLKSLN